MIAYMHTGGVCAEVLLYSEARFRGVIGRIPRWRPRASDSAAMRSAYRVLTIAFDGLPM